MWKVYFNKDDNIQYFIPRHPEEWNCSTYPANDLLSSIIPYFVMVIFFAFFLEMYFSVNGFQIKYLIIYIFLFIIFPIIYSYPHRFVGISDKKIIYKKLFKEQIVIPFDDITQYNSSILTLRIKTKTGESFVLNLKNYSMSCVTMIKELIKEKLEKKLGG